MGFYAERIFPWVLDTLESPEMGRQRNLALSGVRGHVLEIGLGTGSNLPFYPRDVQTITAIEPVAGMNGRATRRAARAGRRLELVRHSGESLPFENDRFDSVVITLVLCSVPDVSAVLSEAARVLHPDGKYFFLEHVASAEARIRRWQQRLNGLNRCIGCGCELIRDTDRLIAASPFTLEALERVTLPGRYRFYPLIRGVATRQRRDTVPRG